MSLEDKGAKMKAIIQRYKVRLVAANKELEVMGAVKEENQKLCSEVKVGMRPSLLHACASLKGILVTHKSKTSSAAGAKPKRISSRDPRRRSRKTQVLFIIWGCQGRAQ
jgi:hypothetical protein